jgi:tetratricopeptide (TPR) repeat protein
MRRLIATSVILLALLAGCVTSGPSKSMSLYIDDMYEGRKALMAREYQKALDLFLSANQRQASAAALGFAGATCYRMGDIRRADEYLTRAWRLNKNSDAVWLILGYRSLVLMQEGRDAEGLEMLSAYADIYKFLEPQSASIGDLQQMLNSGHINVPYVEVLLDQEVQQRYVDYNKL